MTLKERYHRFRSWQKEPRRYSTTDTETHHCNNCDHDFSGKYCPVCGQKATIGRITWQSVRENVMLLWGMESHSMPYSVFQLLLRPGYFIGDYISGRQQISYPPVKMLFVMAVVYAIAKQLLGASQEPSEEVEGLEILSSIVFWLRNNPGWGMMTVTLFFTLPTWISFRFSPRHPHHSFPESVFIQLFMSTLMLVCLLLSRLSFIFELLIPFYYYLTYRQLFGYRFWGTLWRLILCFLVWFFAVFWVALLVALLTSSKPILKDDSSLGTTIIALTISLFIPQILLLAFSYWTGKASWKKSIKKTNNQA